jgi:hypothetical protein
MRRDSVYIPFPGITLKNVKYKMPISTISILPFERGITGCNNNCPCRRWVNCRYYCDRRNERIGYKDKISIDIWKYYNDIFKITFEMPIANMNG